MYFILIRTIAIDCPRLGFDPVQIYGSDTFHLHWYFGVKGLVSTELLLDFLFIGCLGNGSLNASSLTRQLCWLCWLQNRCCIGKRHFILGLRNAPYIYTHVWACGFLCLPPPVAELRREDLVFRTITGIRSYPKEVYRSHYAQCIQDLCPYNSNLTF